MEKINDRIVIIGDTEASEAAKVLINVLNQLIDRQNKIVEIVKLVVLSSGGLPVEAIDKAKKLE